MARVVHDTNLETRAARLRLKVRRKPYWRVLEKGCHLGYRRNGSGSGSWVARRFLGGAKYHETRLEAADDLTEADGETALTFSQAQEKARRWARSQERQQRGLAAESGPYLVARACEDYFKAYVARGGKAPYPTRKTIDIHILPALGLLEVAKLSTKLIREWHQGLVVAPLRLRTGKLASNQNSQVIDPGDAEAMRSRRATANRILTVLKAVLNHTYHDRLVPSDEAWRAVKPFKAVDVPVIRYLTADECRRLANACQPDIRPLVQAALLTGCRYGELTRLRCDDVNLDAGMVTIREAKGGKPRHVVLTDEAKALFRARCMGRGGNEVIFLRADGKPWKEAHQARRMAEACTRAGIKPAPNFHVLRHTHASTLAMKGVPMGVIAAQLGHADTRITERHYAHLAPNYIADTIRSAFPILDFHEAQSNVVPLDRHNS